MKDLIDSANLDEIRALSEYLPIAGVTSNPSIVKKEGSVPFFAHMREIRSIIGNLRPLHIQVTATDYDATHRRYFVMLTRKYSSRFPSTLKGSRSSKPSVARGQT